MDATDADLSLELEFAAELAVEDVEGAVDVAGAGPAATATVEEGAPAAVSDGAASAAASSGAAIIAEKPKGKPPRSVERTQVCVCACVC